MMRTKGPSVGPRTKRPSVTPGPIVSSVRPLNHFRWRSSDGEATAEPFDMACALVWLVCRVKHLTSP
jgi:hypothetical protein